MKRCDKVDNLLQRLLFPFVKRVLGVAIIAAQIAERQPHKNTTLPGPGALALDRLIDFVDRQRLFAHSLGTRNITGRIFASPQRSWSVSSGETQDKNRPPARRRFAVDWPASRVARKLRRQSCCAAHSFLRSPTECCSTKSGHNPRRAGSPVPEKSWNVRAHFCLLPATRKFS